MKKIIILGIALGSMMGFESAVGMKQKLEQNFIKTLFFRSELIGTIKPFLSETISVKNIPVAYRTPQFIKFLKTSEIDIEGSQNFITREESESESRIKQIIEEDNLELLQRETENNENIIVEDGFFEVENMKIPLLHYCVMKKAIKCFKFLILNGVNPAQTLIFPTRSMSENNPYPWDCMAITICFGEWEMMKILEERGYNKLNNPNVWEAAALTHRNNLLKLFISNKGEIANFDKCLQKGIEGAVKGNNIKGTIVLISNDASIKAMDEMGRMPLHPAAVRDSDKIGELLISKGADINAKDDYGKTLLYVALENKSEKMGELLISKGADINAKDRLWFQTPLHVALENKLDKIGEILISKGANINAKDHERQTPLHLAAKQDSNKIGELMISKGADINAKNDYGQTPLHLAARKDSNKIGELLISKGADINAKDRMSKTPLHVAVEEDSIKIVELLISAGADINAKDRMSKTPLAIARWWGRRKMEQLLLSHGAHE